MKLSVKTSLAILIISFTLIFVVFWRADDSSLINADSKTEQYLDTSPLPVNPVSTSQQETKQNKPASIEELLIEESIGSRMRDVAVAYQQQNRYPHYSIPVIDQALAKSPQAFEVASVSSATFDEHGNALPFRLLAATDKPEYAVGESITLQVIVDGAEETSAIFATAVMKPTEGNQPLTIPQSLTPFNQAQAEFRTRFNTAGIQIEGDAQEFLAVITTEIEGREHLTSVPVVISQVSAELLNVDRVEQLDDFLAITLDFQVHQAGYYFVKAYLDDAKSEKALVSLQTEGRMGVGSESLVLKAHHQALKDAGSQGPYTLRIIRSFRGAKPGESNDVPTAISQQHYQIPEFAFDGYANIPYQDPIVERRIKALMALSSE